MAQWEDQDASVEKRVTGMLQSGSPLLDAAQAQAQKEGNRRGFLNSSTTLASGLKAMIQTATPIASQDAAQIHERNLSAQNFGQQRTITSDTTSSSERIAKLNADTELARQNASDTAALARQNAGDTAALTRQQAADLAATERQRLSDSAAAERQRLSDLAQMDRTRFTSEMEAAQRNLDRINQKEMQGAALTSEEVRAREQLSNSLTIARENNLITVRGQDSNATLTREGYANQTTIAGMNNQQNSQAQLAQSLMNANSIYTTGLNAINSNTDMPAETRNAQMVNLRAQYDSNIKLLEQVFNVRLDWARPPTT